MTGNDRLIPVGKTPLDLDVAKIEKSAGNAPIHLRIEQEGYEAENIILPHGIPAGRHEVSVNLKKTPTTAPEKTAAGEPQERPSVALCPAINIPPPNVCPTYPETAFSQIAAGVAEAQAAVNHRDYAKAEALLSNLLSTYNDVAPLHALLGNVLYLKRDLAKALKSYQRALRLNPQDAQTAKLVRRLKSMEGNPRGGNEP
jgi:tetratricopeptide (TPR) repeat protein